MTEILFRRNQVRVLTVAAFFEQYVANLINISPTFFRIQLISHGRNLVSITSQCEKSDIVSNIWFQYAIPQSLDLVKIHHRNSERKNR